MTKTLTFISGLLGLLMLTTACSGGSAASDRSAGNTAPYTVLLLGDSIAEGEAVALTEAFAASDVHFRSFAAEGGGNVVGPFADKHWEKLPGQIASADPSVVVYQITTYDWGTEKEQQAAYDKLLDTVADAGAKLVFVTMPPIRPDDFYTPHMAELEQATGAARVVAEASSGRASLLDASDVWGSTYQQERDGKTDRSSDGIHTCPQGAARFAAWLLDGLSELFHGFTPADPKSWANTGWADDKHFIGC